ncbi:MAG: DUF4332 domain-containing protein [Chloroflexi bacterium]|nr:DUF4332 domain-containing protein [Chloroflexota bacterium]
MKHRNKESTQQKRSCGGCFLRIVALTLIVWAIVKLRQYLAPAEVTPATSPFSPTTPAPPPTPENDAPSASASAKAQSDDLRQIQGIGPGYSSKLQEAGIDSFASLAAASDSELDRILQPREFQKLDYESWRQQARALLEQVLQAPSSDDLTRIQGVGSVFAKKLVEAGISSFAQLANQTPAQLEAICQAPDWRKPDYASWIYQARKLSQGKS